MGHFLVKCDILHFLCFHFMFVKVAALVSGQESLDRCTVYDAESKISKLERLAKLIAMQI